MKNILIITIILLSNISVRAQFNTLYPPLSASPNNAGGSITTGNYNTFVGEAAGHSTADGSWNLFLGLHAGYSNISGSSNTFMGVDAGYYMGYSTSVFNNTFIGYESGASAIEGDENICIGNSSGESFSIGSNNIYIGDFTVPSTSTGNYDIALGTYADIADNLTNAIVIGSNSYVFSSNTMVLGGVYGSGATDVLIGYASTSGYQLDVDGSTRCTSGSWNISDQRFKQNIESIDNALSLINKLHPVRYEFKENAYADADKKVKMNFPKGKQIGFIAQELETVLPELVSTDNKGIKAVNYAQMVSVLAEGIKEQDAEIKTLQAANEALISQVNDIYTRLSEMNMSIGQCCTSNASQSTSVGTLNNTMNAMLYQNTPNPFNEQTSIRYFLPANTQGASIVIVSTVGSVIQTIPLTQTGNSELIIPAGTLVPGTYYYQMLIANQTIDSKKMVVIK